MLDLSNPAVAADRGLLHHVDPHHHELADQFPGAELAPATGGVDLGASIIECGWACWRRQELASAGAVASS